MLHKILMQHMFTIFSLRIISTITVHSRLTSDISLLLELSVRKSKLGHRSKCDLKMDLNKLKELKGRKLRGNKTNVLDIV